MQRRSFLATILGTVGTLLGYDAKADQWTELDRPEPEPDAYLDDGPFPAPAGTIFRCEQGHPICSAIAQIDAGTPNWYRNIGYWQQTPPEVGDPMPTCAKCGTKVVFWRNKGRINYLGPGIHYG